MDGRPVNKSNTQINEQSETHQNNDSLSESILSRRRLELLQIVSQENALNRSHKERVFYEATDAGSISGANDGSDSEDDSNLKLFKVKERRRVIRQCKIISRSRAKAALNVLENNVKRRKEKLSNEKKRLKELEKHCHNNAARTFMPNEYEHTWNSPMYLVKCIRSSILSRDWNTLTKLLLLLLKCGKTYVPYVKQITTLNCMHNPLDNNSEILEELRKLCVVAARK